jgi:2-haloacid dehalogenase
MLREQLRFAALAALFDEIMSVDEAGALKPAPEVYHYATERLDLNPGAIWMVAAHGWDIAGATRAGLRGAFVARPGQTPDPFAPPEIIGADLLEVAHTIVAESARRQVG